MKKTRIRESEIELSAEARAAAHARKNGAAAAPSPSPRAKGARARERLAERVREAGERLTPERRKILEAALAALLQEGDDAASLAALEGALAPLRARAAPPDPPLPFADRVRRSLDVMTRRADQIDRPIATPWPSVTAALRGGFWPGLYTLTSGTGMGKTQWAIQCALDAAEAFRDAYKTKILLTAVRATRVPPGEAFDDQNRIGPAFADLTLAELEDWARTHGVALPEGGPDRVAYVALELGDVDLTARLLGLMAARAGLTGERGAPGELGGKYPLKWSDLFYGRLPRALVEVRKTLAPALAALPIEVETAEAIGWSYRQLLALAERVKPRLLVLDYSQLVAAPKDGPYARHEELRETIGNVAKVSRGLARTGLAVLALSSTARGNYTVFRRGKDGAGGTELLWREDPGELVGMGKESGELEFTADVVLALVREPKDTPKPSSDCSEAEVRTRNRWREAQEHGPHAYPMNVVVAKGRGFPTSVMTQIFDGSRFLEADD